MELSNLAQKPQLVKLTIKEPKIVEKYGDELEFYMYDRQSLDVFAKFADAKEDGANSNMIHMLVNIILDKDGNPVMKDDLILPMDVVTECIKAAGETLGK